MEAVMKQPQPDYWKNEKMKRKTARIVAFYQLRDLAKNSEDKYFISAIWDILCTYLRDMTSTEHYRKKEGGERPSMECTALLDVLFGHESRAMFGGMGANLSKVYLRKADLEAANLSNIDFIQADLTDASY